VFSVVCPKYWLSSVVQIIGTIYAIITGFIIVNVWGKYLSLVRAVELEATNLKNVYLLAKRLDSDFAYQVGKKIEIYLKKAIGMYWRGDIGKSDFQVAYYGMILSIQPYLPKTTVEVEIFTNLVDELRKATDSKANIQSLIDSKMPKIFLSLLVLLSGVLIFGFYFFNYDNQILATISITIVSTAVALVAVIIYDINDPFKLGFWAIKPTAFLECQHLIQQSNDQVAVA